MYTRNYPQEKSGIMIPESYGGTALREEEGERSSGIPSMGGTPINKNPWESENQITTSDSEPTSAEPSSLFSRLPIANFFKDFLHFDNFSLQNIGAEEILIIGVAAFLFFTKQGDKECAIMLLLLLFFK